MKDKVTKIKKVLNLIFLKSFLGWLLLGVVIFFIATLLKYSMDYRLIFTGLIFTFGSMIYCWRQAHELSKSPDLDLFFIFEEELKKEFTLKRNKRYEIEIIVKNKGDNIADKYTAILGFEAIEELNSLSYKQTEGLKSEFTKNFYKYSEKRNGKEFIKLEYKSDDRNFIFPNFGNSLGLINLEYSKYTSPHIIEYQLLANNMNLKNGEIKIHIS